VPDTTIDEIKRRLDVVDVIGQTVQLKRSGKAFKGLCPFHNEKSGSFYVWPDTGTWRCFGCNEGGDLFSFVQKRDNLDFREALRFLGERAGVTIEEHVRPDPGARQERDRLLAILESTALFYRASLMGEAGARTRAYAAERGIEPAAAERFGLGYSDASGRGLERHLTRAGYGIEECVKAGAIGQTEDGRTYDRFRDRLIFPIRDVDGHVIGFGGRALHPDQQPKYLNSPQNELFDKGNNLYALDQARESIRQQGRAIVVEGYMDALIPHQAGFTNVVATLGTALTERHVQLLRRQSAREIVLCLDSDAAGLRAALRGSGVAHEGTRDEAPRIDFGLLNRSERFRGRDAAAIFAPRRTVLKAFSLSGGKDPDEVVRQDPDQWRRESEAAQPIVEFVFANIPRVYDLSQTEGRRDAAQAAVGLVYDVADPIDRDQYLQRLATIIGTGVDVLRELLRRRMHVVQRPDDRPPAVGAALSPGDGGSGPSARAAVVGAGDGAATFASAQRGVSPDEQLQELVISLLLRVGVVETWPDPHDFTGPAHRAILEHLQNGPAWPDVATAIDRVRQTLGSSVDEILNRLQVRDQQNERVSPEELTRELDVRRLELRKHRLIGQHQALVSALKEEGGGLDIAAHRASYEQLKRLQDEIGETTAEQQRLGVVGTASWNIRRGQEVLGG
jgi:DNA primase